MQGRLSTRVAALGALVLAAISLAVVYGLYGLKGTEVQAQEGECPSPRLIEEITGSGSQQTAPFNTTTSLFRLSYEVQSDRPTAPFLLYVKEADEADAPSVGNATTEGTTSDEAFINAPPGRYFLDITGDGQYTIRIEECGDEGEANPGEGKSTEGTTSPKTPSPPAPKTPTTPPKTPSPAPKTPSPSPSPPQGTLMTAGGPTVGPVPIMPNGSCPREFPDKRDGACYAT